MTQPPTIESNLAELGITLPAMAVPKANYAPYTISDGQLLVSGTLPLHEGKPAGQGKVGASLSAEEAAEIAKLCGINVLAAVKHACEGDLERVQRCLKLGVFVNATPEFTEQARVANGVSDFMVAALGEERGAHARFAVGVASLPFGVAVEVDGAFAIA